MVGTVWLALILRTEILSNVQYNCYYQFSSSESKELQIPRNINGGFGFGMINDDSFQPYYPYLLYKLIGTNIAVGDEIIKSTSTSDNVRVLAWLHDGKTYTLVISKVDLPTLVKFVDLHEGVQFHLIDNSIPYTNPQVQEGIVNASNQILLKGYAVVLLESNIK
jgi:hypothetical protein